MSTTTKNVGRVSIVPKGDWNINNTYIRLDLVTYNGNSYIAKKDVPKNIQLSNNNYWMLMASKGGQGEQGEQGAPFAIMKSYASIAAMNADFSNTDVQNGQFVIIDTGNVQDPDNAKLYYKGSNNYVFVTDMSGAAGIQGPRGASAYEQAVAGGYEGTEAQFNEDLADFKELSEQAASSATAADNSAKDAEAYAIGKRGGTDVGSTDSAYHNNAKYYAEQAALIVDDVEQVMTPTTIGPTALATFDASVAGMPLKGLTANIGPVQSGSGDPSPDNVRPITGWTGCKLHHTGVSLIGGDAFIGYTFSKTATGYKLSYNGSSIGNRASGYADIRGLPAGRYTIEMLNPSYPEGAEVNIRRNTAGNTVAMGIIVGSSAFGRRTYDIPENTTSLQLYIIPGTMPLNTSITMSDIVLVRESDESEPYKGNTYNITFPTEAGTVYGGTLDVVNRKLNSYPYYSSYNGETIIGPWISSMDVYTPGATPTLGAQVVDIGGAATSCDLSGVPEITTLFGENNIWANRGDVTVTYGAYLETIKVYTDQAADSAATAEAVLASIPDDYTELNNKINNLNNTFMAEYDVTTFNAIDTNVTAGNLVVLKQEGFGGGYTYTVLSGHSFGEHGGFPWRQYVFGGTPRLVGSYVAYDEWACDSDNVWTHTYNRVDNINSDIVGPFYANNSYAVGDFVQQSGKIYRFVAPHTAGSYWSTSEVVEVVLADEIGDLKSDFNMFEARNVLQTQLVRGRYIKGSGDGAGTPAANSKFVMTKTLLGGYGQKISIELTNPTYEYYVSYYGDNGALDGTDYLGYSGYNSTIFVIPEQAKLIGITFRRVDQGELTSDALTEISNSLYFYGVTDISLSESGKSADAKATGTAIENAGIYWSHDVNYLIPTYDGLIAKYDELCSMYPQYITKNTLTSGDFTNYEYVLTIGNYNSQNGQRGQDAEIAKPTILISSGVHGYERSSVMGLYGVVKAMCENVESLNKIIYAANYRIIPIACPWGYTNDSRVNNNGVNINRNFDTTDWTLLPEGLQYSGTEPANQPETKVMQTWLETHNDALIYIDWHNSGYLNEISCLLGLNTTETTKWKKKYLTSLNNVIPWWMKGRNIPPTNIYAYTGAPTVEYSNTGTAVTYAREHNIETAFVLETSWNVIDTGKHSKFSLGVGQEAFANMLVGFADLIDNSNAAILG